MLFDFGFFIFIFAKNTVSYNTIKELVNFCKPITAGRAYILTQQVSVHILTPLVISIYPEA